MRRSFQSNSIASSNLSISDRCNFGGKKKKKKNTHREAVLELRSSEQRRKS